MRINRFLAAATGLSRRAADAAVANGDVMVNGQSATIGQDIHDRDVVVYKGKTLRLTDTAHKITIVLHKPVGYVSSRNGQGSRTIYELLPMELHQLKPVGRLDKDSSGLLLLTNDGELTQQLTHPSFQKVKRYEVELDKPLQPLHRQMISDHGVQLEDGPSKLALERLVDNDDAMWQVIMHEGRNRQIRRTFAALGYTVTKLHRTSFGLYSLEALQPGSYKTVQPR
jgi:23S rRNA pseudouridine2605 synthase